MSEPYLTSPSDWLQIIPALNPTMFFEHIKSALAELSWAHSIQIGWAALGSSRSGWLGTLGHVLVGLAGQSSLSGAPSVNKILGRSCGGSFVSSPRRLARETQRKMYGDAGADHLLSLLAI